MEQPKLPIKEVRTQYADLLVRYEALTKTSKRLYQQAKAYRKALTLVHDTIGLHGADPGTAAAGCIGCQYRKARHNGEVVWYECCRENQCADYRALIAVDDVMKLPRLQGKPTNDL